MNRRLLLTALALAVAPCVMAADTAVKLVALAAPKPEARAAPAGALPTVNVPADAVHLVFLADPRPILLRVRIQVDGRPPLAAWNEFVYALFQHLDRDDDLALSKEEASRIPSAQQLQQFRNGFFNANGGNAPLREVDANGDGKVSLDELASYYKRAGNGPVQLMVTQALPYGANALTEGMFNYLDLNKDGKLSANEMALAAESLRPFDINDDETISVQEAAPSTNLNFFPQVQPVVLGNRPGPFTPPFLLFGRGEFSPRLAQLAVAKYDKNRDNKLSPTEIGLSKEVFSKLDANRDGQLTPEELAGLFNFPPDGALTFRFDNTGKTPGFESGPATGPPLPDALTSRPLGDGIVFDLGDSQLELLKGGFQINNFDYGQYYKMQFKNADTDKNGVLDAKELQQPQYQFFRLLLPFADRDVDGRLSEKELLAFLDIQTKCNKSLTYITVTDSGRELFALLDSDRDGQLGLRELRTSWSSLAPLDRNGDGFITKSEIPSQFQLLLSRGQPAYNARLASATSVFYGGMTQPNYSAPSKGPRWFRKMDRNGDGDVSAAEFLGTKAEFQRLDKNGDGLIDVNEAEAGAPTPTKPVPKTAALRTR